MYLLFAATPFRGLAQANYDSLIVGNWQGSSICQVKNSPFHDEMVVYHISKKHGSDTINILANKIINGVEEEMGIIPFTFNSKTNQLFSTAYNSRWTLTLENEKLEGTLYVKGVLYRIIKLSRKK